MNIIIDFDSVVADSSNVILSMLRDKFHSIDNYNLSELEWDFSPFAKNETEKSWAISRFSSHDFYDILTPVNGCIPVVNKWYEDDRVHTILCSKKHRGTYDFTDAWLQKCNVKFNSVVYMHDFDKSIIGNSNDIIIDDKLECMAGNRKLKILFGNYGYQKTELKEMGMDTSFDILSHDMIRLHNWSDVDSYIDKVLK